MPVTWHTEGRRQPSLIGKDPAGKPLWGGPYTSYQGAAIVLVGLLAWNTRWLWGANLPKLEQMVVTVAVAAAASYGAGRIDYTQIYPVWNTVGWCHTQVNQLMRPRGTHMATGRPRRAPKPLGRNSPPTWILDYDPPRPQPDLDTTVAPQISTGQDTVTAATHTPALAPIPVSAAGLSSAWRAGFEADAPTVEHRTTATGGAHPATFTRSPQPQSPERQPLERQPVGRASGLEAFLAAAGHHQENPR